jgi:hypothetical protein
LQIFRRFVHEPEGKVLRQTRFRKRLDKHLNSNYQNY